LQVATEAITETEIEKWKNYT